MPWLHTACGCCKYCLSGWETLCDAQRNTGYSVNGGFAQYVLADPNYVGRLPDRLEFDAAAPVLCAGVTVYKGLKETDTRPGDTVVVSGIGGLGHLAVQYAKAMGLHVIAVDIADDKLELARKMGADAGVNATNRSGRGGQEAVRRCRRRARHGRVTEAFGQALGMLGKRGTMALVGLPPGTFPLAIFDTVLTRKTIRGSIVGTRLDLTECARVRRRGQGPMPFLEREARPDPTRSSNRGCALARSKAASS